VSRTFTNFWVLRHKCGSRYAKKAIKVSKDSDDSLDTNKNLSQKNGSVGLRPRPDNLSQKHRPLCRHPQRNPNSTRNKFVSNMNWKTSRVRRWFEQLFSSIGWRVMLVQSSGVEDPDFGV